MRPLPLGVRIVLLVIPLALMPLIGLAGIAYYYLEATVRADIDSAELRVLSDAVGFVETSVTDTLRLTHEVAALPQVVRASDQPADTSALADAARALALSLHLSRAATRIMLVGADGRTIAEAGVAAPAATSARDRLLRAIAGPLAPADGQRYIGGVRGEPVAMIVHPVPSRARAFIVADVDGSRMQRTLESMAGPPRGAFALVLTDGDLIAATPRPSPALTSADWRDLTHQTPDTPSVLRPGRSSAGERVMGGSAGGFVSLDAPGSTPQALHVVRFVRDIDSLTRIRELRRTALLFAGVAVAFGLIGAGVIARTVVHPLNALLEMTRRIGEGQFNVSLTQTRNDEIGQLVGAFNAMAASLSEYQERLVHAETFAALGRVASTVAHEIRNPLNAMRGCIEYLRLKRPDDALLQHHATIIGEEITALDEFVGDFLKVARLESPRMATTDLPALLRTHLALHDVRAAEHGVTFELQIDSPVPPVTADPKQLGMVFENLINNGIDAMPDGGIFRLGVMQDGTRVVVTFTDTGVGMTAATLRQIFTPFFTTKPEGAGIGLAISRRIVEAHGGLLQCESLEQAGTTFRLTLPLTTTEGDDSSATIA